jgi:hypothetical protein
MAVYKRHYKRYDGPITDERWRFTVLPLFVPDGVRVERLHGVFHVVFHAVDHRAGHSVSSLER